MLSLNIESVVITHFSVCPQLRSWVITPLWSHCIPPILLISHIKLYIASVCEHPRFYLLTVSGDCVEEADIDSFSCLPKSSDAPLKNWKTTHVARPRVSRVDQMNKPQISLLCRAKAPPSLWPVFSSQHSGDRDILANSLGDSSEVTSARLGLMM